MKISGPKWVGLALFGVFFGLALQLRQRDFEFLVEPDFFWQMIDRFAVFFSTLDALVLPMPFPLVYFDGHHILYGLVDLGLRKFVASFDTLGNYFPNDLSYALGAAALVNAVAYAAACTIFFAAIYRITGYIAVAGAMAVGLFFAPQMININMMRIDFLNMLPLAVIFYCSCMLAAGQERARHAIALGLAMAFAVTLKLNGAFFGVIPAMAAIAAVQFNRSFVGRLIRFVSVSVGVFLVAYLLLMGRYLYLMSPWEIVQLYKATFAELYLWAPQMTGPVTYYNIYLMRSSGVPFITLYLTCALATIVLAVRDRSRVAVFLALVFIAVSGGGMLSLKYARGGYHVLPIFFAVVGFSIAAVLDAHIHRYIKGAVVALMGVAFLSSMWTAFQNYRRVVLYREMEAVGLHALKRQPRDWLRAHVPSGAAICVQSGSEWTLPPLDGFKVVHAPLALPYVDLQALARTPPPTLQDATKSCDVIVTSNWHKNLYESIMAKNSMEMASRWHEFFDDLSRRYPTVIFSSPFAAPAKYITINDLRGAK